MNKSFWLGSDATEQFCSHKATMPSSEYWRDNVLNIQSLRRAAIVAVSVVGLMGLSGTASAATASASTWSQLHPRRVEVNHRLHRQSERIANRVATGKMTIARAARLHREDRAVRREERTMASLNHGHITKVEKHALNQQENKISRRIMK